MKNIVYIKKIGNSWTYCDIGGFCVDKDGNPVYMPILLDDRPEDYPLCEARTEVE